MRLFLATQLLLALAAAGIVPRKASYDGAKVFRMPVGHEAEKMKTLIHDLHLSTWNGDAKDDAIIDLFVPAEKVVDFEEATLDLETEVMHEDLGASIAEESRFDSLSGATNLTWFESYHPLSDHMRWIDDLQAAYPDNSAVIVSGESTEGRPIKGLHIFGNDGPGNRPAIIWHGTTHAREWITTMVVEYMTWGLLSNYTTDPDIKKYVDSYDHYIFPVANPDGFLFAQTTDRLWRKNRFQNEGTLCAGVDLNRNWDSHWNVPGGASTEPCSQTYKGLAPADQAEIQVHQSFLQRLDANPLGVKMFIDWHAYSQLFLTPYGWTCNDLPPNSDDHQRLAQAFANGLETVYGTEYTTGPACNTIYQTTGSSDDYAYEKANAEFSFAAELRDTGKFGFVLPPRQIVPSGIETFTGYKALMEEII